MKTSPGDCFLNFNPGFTGLGCGGSSDYTYFLHVPAICLTVAFVKLQDYLVQVKNHLLSSFWSYSNEQWTHIAKPVDKSSVAL